jgi:hypothetical protein
MYRKELKKDFFKMMNARLVAEGWDTVTQFTQKSKVPYTVETVRRGFVDCGVKQLSADTLAVILRYLNYSRGEIKEILETYTDDTEMTKLIGDDASSTLTADQAAWVEIFNKLEAGRPGLAAQMVGQIELAAKLANIDITEEAKVIGRKGGKKGGH